MKQLLRRLWQWRGRLAGRFNAARDPFKNELFAAVGRPRLRVEMAATVARFHPWRRNVCGDGQFPYLVR
jgi:hypothetical protein